MANVDWNYHRVGCNSCFKAAEFLAQRGVTLKNQVDARKVPLEDVEGLKLLEDANELYVTRGKKILHFDLRRNRPDDQTILELIIGRSGKLRAPTLKLGRTVIVGFDEETYANLFG